MFGQKEDDEPRTQQRSSPQVNTQDVSAAKLLTVSGDYAKIEGTFEIADSLEVECEIGGELNVRGKLVIGQNGSVNANVRTVDAVIKGTYEGNMIATGNVEIAATGRVTGNITTDSLVISKGGFFNGNVTRIKEEDKKEGRMFLMEEEERKANAQSSAGRTMDSASSAGKSGDSGSSSGSSDKDEKKEESEQGDLERVVQSSRNV